MAVEGQEYGARVPAKTGYSSKFISSASSSSTAMSWGDLACLRRPQNVSWRSRRETYSKPCR